MHLNTLPGRFLGTELRRLRDHHGWSQSDLAERTGFSDALVGYVENAHRVASERFAVACDAAFGTGTYLTRLCGLARQFGTPHAPLRELLEAARTLRISDPLLVPALAQADAYARAVLHASHVPAERVDELLANRPRLSALLGTSPELRAWLVIDETTLYRPIGGAATLRRQLRELLALIDTGRVIAQILPTTSPATALLRVPRVVMAFGDATVLACLPGAEPDDGCERYGDATRHLRADDLLRAAAHPPGVSRGMIATAAR